MKFLPIVWRNLLRRKFRTIFTMGAIFFAFLLFGVLMAIRSAFSMGVDMAGQNRLMVMDKVSIINPLPASSITMLNAARSAIRTPNSRKAVKIDSTVKIVRTFRRSRLRQTRGRNFMPPPR